MFVGEIRQNPSFHNSSRKFMLAIPKPKCSGKLKKQKMLHFIIHKFNDFLSSYFIIIQFRFYICKYLNIYFIYYIIKFFAILSKKYKL